MSAPTVEEGIMMSEKLYPTSRNVVATEAAPAAIGPYSQAVRAGNVLYCSGQIALDAATGLLMTGDVASQTERVLQNLGEVLKAGGSSFEQVVRTTIFVTDMNDFSTVNDVYAQYFPTQPPARACVEVRGLPKGASVEIDAIALCS